MFFSRITLATAGMVGAAVALLPSPVRNYQPAEFDVTRVYDHEKLYDGPVSVDVEADVEVTLDLDVDADIAGIISIGADNYETDSLLKLDLSGLKAYVAVDLSASASLYTSIELVASAELDIDTGILEAHLGAAFALDLLLSVDAAIDLSAGVYVSFGEGDYISVDVDTQEVADSSLLGLKVKALDVAVGVEVDLSVEIEVKLGLRLRTHISLDAGVDLLGLDVLDAGAEIAIWVDLFEHTLVLVETGDCVLSVKSKLLLVLGVCVDLEVGVLDLLDISLAPEVMVTLAAAVGLDLCLPERGNCDYCKYKDDEGKEDGEGKDEYDDEEGEHIPTYVHSAAYPEVTSGPGKDLVTKTKYETKTYVVTSCHASVPNCPATETEKITHTTVNKYVTVCPADETDAPKPKPTKSYTKHYETVTKDLEEFKPCEPTSSTYVPVHKPEEPTKTYVPVKPTADKPEGTPYPPPAHTPVVPEHPVVPPVETPIVPPPAETPIVPPPAETPVFPPVESPVVPPVVTPTPTPPPQSGAGSIKAGLAILIPAALMML